MESEKNYGIVIYNTNNFTKNNKDYFLKYPEEISVKR